MRFVLVQKTTARTGCAATAFVTAGFLALEVYKFISLRIEFVGRTESRRDMRFVRVQKTKARTGCAATAFVTAVQIQEDTCDSCLYKIPQLARGVPPQPLSPPALCPEKYTS